MTIKLTLIAFAVLAGCYDPGFGNCELACSDQACPSGYTCSAGLCAASGQSCSGSDRDATVDGRDSGAPLDFRNVKWLDASRVTGVIDADRCERSPVLDADGETLLFTRPLATIKSAQDCIATGEIYRAKVTPTGITDVARLTIVANTTTSLALALAVAPGPFTGGTAQDATLVFAYRGSATGSLDTQILATDSTLTATGGVTTLGIPGAPTFTADFRSVVYEREASGQFDLWEKTGMFPDQYPDDGEITAVTSVTSSEAAPALSPDGRVLVFARVESAVTHLYIARRMEVTEDFSTPIRLPTPINSNDGSESEPFIATNGDLYFTSTRDDERLAIRLYQAPAVIAR